MSYSVSEILLKVKELIEANEEIGGYIQIKGEIGTFKIYGKHAYLNLKEKNAILKCVYFSVPREISTTIKEGSIVEAYGYLSIYDARGEFQFYIKSMREISKAGLLILEYEQIKQQLISEKIIPKKPEEKRPLPLFPHRIGVITSKNGAAIQDVKKTIESKYPECTIMIFHTRVQGKAEINISETIQTADRSKTDLLLLVRGGGSIEDLWCFNHPKVVKAVRNCKKPIVVGVGHETDHTLCEYAADFIGSTPTSAAIIAVPDLYSMIESKKSELEKISILILRKNVERKNKLNQLNDTLTRLNPEKIILDGRNSMKSKIDKIVKTIEHKIFIQKNRLDLIHKSLKVPTANLTLQRLETTLIVNFEKIKANDPKKYLKKGFVRLEKKGILVNSVVQLNKGDSVHMFLKDGIAKAKISELRNEKK